MHPWYKGFKEVIEESTTTEPAYITKGIAYVKDGESNTLIISELLIRKSTEDYINFLETLTDGLIEVD